MKLVILGGTGRIGQQLVRCALAQGHQVIAVSRRPLAMTAAHENLTAMAGDVLEQDSLSGPIASADAVVFAVGLPGRGPTITRSAGICSVAKVMHRSGVTRLVAVAPSAATISPGATLARKIALRQFAHKLYHNPYLDVERMEDELRHCDADWSVVRASALRDGPASGRYVVVPAGQVRRERPVTVADFASYVIEHTADRTARHDTVTVTGTA
jgi:putative NADH-flavin reductase